MVFGVRLLQALRELPPPVEPDRRGNYGNQVRDLPEMGAWLAKLQALAAR